MHCVDSEEDAACACVPCKSYTHMWWGVGVQHVVGGWSSGGCHHCWCGVYSVVCLSLQRVTSGFWCASALSGGIGKHPRRRTALCACALALCFMYVRGHVYREEPLFSSSLVGACSFGHPQTQLKMKTLTLTLRAGGGCAWCCWSGSGVWGRRRGQ